MTFHKRESPWPRNGAKEPEKAAVKKKRKRGRAVIPEHVRRQRQVHEMSAEELDALFGVGKWREMGEDITELGCMAHARRKIHKSRDDFPEDANHGLALIKGLYQIEEKAKGSGLGHEEIYALRQEMATTTKDFEGVGREDPRESPSQLWARKSGLLHAQSFRCLAEVY